MNVLAEITKTSSCHYDNWGYLEVSNEGNATTFSAGHGTRTKARKVMTRVRRHNFDGEIWVTISSAQGGRMTQVELQNQLRGDRRQGQDQLEYWTRWAYHYAEAIARGWSYRDADKIAHRTAEAETQKEAA